MNKKPINPYTSLLNEIKSFCRALQHRNTQGMFSWNKEQLDGRRAYRVDDIHQRVLAAKQLGYEVIIVANEETMEIKYRKAIEIPFEWRS